MAAAVLIVLAALVLTLSATTIVYVFGIRSKSAAVRNAARRFHHAVGNPLQMRSAGTPAASASLIRHQGRITGRAYETPVWAAPTEDGFVIPIVYGSRTDWLKNVLARETADIVHDGETYPVDQPEIVPMESARKYFPATIQRLHRLVRVDRCLMVRRRQMKQQSEDQVIPYPKSRRFMTEAIRSTRNKPMMHGLLEVDVTKARAYLREVKARTGESPSFTAFIIACLGRAIDEHKYMHALWKGRHHLILYEEVDVMTWIEREVAGQPVVLLCIVRAINHKSFHQIHDEIRAAQVQDVAKFDEGGAKESQLLPAWLYRPYFALATRIGKCFPQLWKQSWGTVTLTAVGMEGKGAGWGIWTTSPSVCWIKVGGIGQKREEVDGQMTIRDYLSLTVSFDHNMVDGAPAARFTQRFKELIESGYGLPVDDEAIAEPIARQPVPEPLGVAR